jgi:BlaI family penicillinase repressor
MPQLRLTALQFQIMDIFWEQGGLSVREVHGALPVPRPAYTTIQTLIGRLETKGALKRTRKIGNAYLFEASVSRDSVQKRALDEFLALFGGRPKLLMARLAESGKLTLEDVQEAEQHLRDIAQKRGRKK